MFGLAEPEVTANSLGQTETFGPHSSEYPGVTLPRDRSGSFGRAVGSIERKVIDPETGETLPPNTAGELCVRGYSLMQGYYKREREETFEKDGFFRTGDICSLSEDGHLFFSGRSSDMIKTMGVNVSAREVELVIAAEPDVIEAAVLAMNLPDRGESVVAAVLCRPGAQPDEDDLKARLRASLSDYKVPKRIFFLSAEQFPRTGAGKVQKQQLRALLAESK
jgi:acyl-CoA synthetase (AMP-forming)/AMP-acid ligase II